MGGGSIDERCPKVAHGDPAEAGRGGAPTGGGEETGVMRGRADTAGRGVDTTRRKRTTFRIDR